LRGGGGALGVSWRDGVEERCAPWLLRSRRGDLPLQGRRSALARPPRACSRLPSCFGLSARTTSVSHRLFPSIHTPFQQRFAEPQNTSHEPTHLAPIPPPTPLGFAHTEATPTPHTYNLHFTFSHPEPGGVLLRARPAKAHADCYLLHIVRITTCSCIYERSARRLGLSIFRRYPYRGRADVSGRLPLTAQ
jgi:hypothetical protein